MEQQQVRIRELEQQLQKITQERDDYAQDVEGMCLQQKGTPFFSFKTSNGLNERLAAAEKEAREYKRQLTASSESLRSAEVELQQVRDARRSAERSCAEASARGDALDLELGKYKAQLALVLGERDRASSDLEEATRACARQELRAKEAESLAASEARRRADAEARKAASAERLAEAQADLAARRAECREVPVLRGQLAEGRHEIDDLTAERRSLLSRLEAADLEAVQQAARLADAAAVTTQLRVQAAHDLGRLTEFERQAAAAQADTQVQQQRMQQLQTQLTAAQLELERYGHGGGGGGTNGGASSSDEGEAGGGAADALPGGFAWAGSGTGSRGPGRQDSGLDSERDELVGAGGSGTSGAIGEWAMPPGVAELQALVQKLERERRKAMRQLERQRRIHDDEAEQLTIYAALVRDLKIKLATAVQEKVEALLRMAAASPGLEVRVNERYDRGGNNGNNGNGGTAPNSAGCSPHNAGLHPAVAALAASRRMPAAVFAAGAAAGAATALLATADSTGAGAAFEAEAARGAELRARLERVEAASVTAHEFLLQLQAASTVLWSAGSTPAKRWQASSQVSRVQEAAASLRKKLDLQKADAERRALAAAAAAALAAPPPPLPPLPPAASAVGIAAASPPRGGAGGMAAVGSASPSSWSFPELRSQQLPFDAASATGAASGWGGSNRRSTAESQLPPPVPPVRSGGLMSLLMRGGAAASAAAPAAGGSQSPVGDARAAVTEGVLGVGRLPHRGSHGSGPSAAAGAADAGNNGGAPAISETDAEELARSLRMEHAVAGALLELVEFGVLALDTFSRMSAMSSLADS